MGIMILDTTTLYLYVETPLHAGVGSGLSSIDLPIQRERTTQYPMIQGSSIKGKLRSVAEAATKGERPIWRKDDVEVVFGPEKSADHAGALIVGDARILLFPVRSLSGVFAYTTSHDVLNRFLRGINRTEANLAWKVPPEKPNTALVTEKINSRVAIDETLVLEEFSFTAEKSDEVDTIAQWIAENALPQTNEYAYWRQKMRDSLVILPDNDFRDFVVNATEIITRIRIKRDTKTVDNGALWTEEHLPSDTLFYVPIYATNSRKSKNGANGKNEANSSDLSTATSILEKARSLEKNQQGYIQLGGDETVGRGMVRMHWQRQEVK
jgi:CRISPR-associated protein Cmr4